MARMFQRLMQSARLNEPVSGSYASTHPLSLQRQSDIENRLSNAPQKENYYSDDDFWSVRAATRVIQARGGMALQQLKQQFEEESKSEHALEQAAALYGWAFAELKAKQYSQSQEYLNKAKQKQPNVAIDILEAEVLLAQKKTQQALDIAQQAWRAHSNQQALALVYTHAMQELGQDQEVIGFLKQQIDKWPNEPRWYQLIAKSYERHQQPIEARKAMAEYYERVGALPTAVEQLRQARHMSQDFYEQSRLDVAIRELQDRLERERDLLSRFRS